MTTKTAGDRPGVLRGRPASRASAVVHELEDAVRRCLDVDHVVLTSSAALAVQRVLLALDPPGRLVIPSLTSPAAGMGVLWSGARPTFADVHPASLTLDPSDVALRIRAGDVVLASHLDGTPCDTDALQQIADAAGAHVVYDATDALGARRRGRPLGGFGTAEVLRLAVTQRSGQGEVGVIATGDPELAEACRAGLHVTAADAAAALATLRGLDDRVGYRNHLASLVRRTLGGTPGVTFPQVASGDVSAATALTLSIEAERFGASASELADALALAGIRTHRPEALHRTQPYAHLGLRAELPVTDRVVERLITIPPPWDRSPVEVERLAEDVRDVQVRAHHAREVLTRGRPGAGSQHEEG